MKIIYLTLLGLSVQLGTFGQQLIKNPLVEEEGLRPCGQNAVLEQMRQEDPQRYESYLQMQELIPQETGENIEKSNTIYTIPVVFHVFHNNGVSNVSDAQIQDALNILNRDFRKLNSDVNNVVAQFLPIADDAKIEFAFAKIAPNGACFEGITRTYSASNITSGQAQINAIIAGNDVFQGIWPHNRYLNIYVCRDIGGSAGYTFHPNNEGYGMAGAPATAVNMYYNGIFMLHSYLGSIGTSNVTKSRALTHEVGHWLNLKHTWGDGNTPGLASNCSDDDGVSDTPNTRGVTSCSLSENGCGPLANVENYMDYSYCSKMFTQGQVTRMRTAIVSAMGGRSNIWTTANLQSVGVIAGGTSLCAAGIEATETGVCSGTSTTFSVTNVATPITAYSWSFPGGTPATSTAATPTVTYNTPGTYNVSVTITTASGSSTLNAPGYITVMSSQPGASLPFTEGFTSTTFPPADWTIDNGGASFTWARRTAGTAPSGNGSAAIDYYNNSAMGDIDDLNTPTLNLSGYSTASLTFDVAYRPYPGQSDKLEVLVAAGCGGTYEVVYSKSGTTLQTQSGNTSPYTNPATWRNETVNLSQYAGSDQVKVKFRGTSGYGNYIYIDNVNISGVTSGPNASFTSSASNSCVGQTVTFTDNSSSAASWLWNFGAGASPATATGAGPHAVTYSSSGAKTVSLTINGGASTSNQTVNINTVPATPAVSVANNCGASVLTATGSGLQWSTGATSASITVANSNSVTVTQSNQGCVSLPATVTPDPMPVPVVSLGALPTVCVYHNPITLTQGNPAGGTYSGQGVTGGNQFSPSVAGLGAKTITYTYTAANGCSNTATAQVVVDGCLNIDAEENTSFSVFPNPTNGNVTITSSFVIDEINVLDNTGRIVERIDGDQSAEVQMNLSHLSAGSYHIHTKMNDVTKITKLIIR